MPTAEHDLLRAMVVLTIKDFQRKKLKAKKLEHICQMCGFYIKAKELSEKMLKWRKHI